MPGLLDVISSRGPGNQRFALSYPTKWRTKFWAESRFLMPSPAERGRHGIYLIDDTRDTTFKKLNKDNKRALPAFFQLQHNMFVLCSVKCAAWAPPQVLCHDKSSSSPRTVDMILRPRRHSSRELQCNIGCFVAAVSSIQQIVPRTKTGVEKRGLGWPMSPRNST
jgi:hypothetical protein